MTLSLALAKNVIQTDLSDSALTQLIAAINADIVRLGGWAYPIVFSAALLDIAIVSESGADSALNRSWLGASPGIGSARITTTSTQVAEIDYTLAALDSGTVQFKLEGDSDTGTATLSELANNIFENLSFYIVCDSGRIELAFKDANAAVSTEPNIVRWTVQTERQDSVRNLLTGIVEYERIRFVIAQKRAGLTMTPAEWQSALDRIAIACLRIAITDQAVASQTMRGGDVEQTRQYLQYNTEYAERLGQIVNLTGNYFSARSYAQTSF